MSEADRAVGTADSVGTMGGWKNLARGRGEGGGIDGAGGDDRVLVESIRACAESDVCELSPVLHTCEFVPISGACVFFSR